MVGGMFEDILSLGFGLPDDLTPSRLLALVLMSFLN